MNNKTASAKITRYGFKVAEQKDSCARDFAVRLFKTAAAVERGYTISAAVDTFFPDECKNQVTDELYKTAFHFGDLLSPKKWFQPKPEPNWLQKLVGDKNYKTFKLDKAYNTGSNLINKADKGLAGNKFIQNRLKGLNADIGLLNKGKILAGGSRLAGKAALPVAALLALHQGYKYLRGGNNRENGNSQEPLQNFSFK